MARTIVTFFARLAKRSVRGKACPTCGGTNTSGPDEDLYYCFDCNKTFR